MEKNVASLAGKNPRLDLNAVRNFERVANQAPMADTPKKGADYRLTHPFDSVIGITGLTNRARRKPPDKAD